MSSMSESSKAYNKSGMVIFLISMVGSLLFFTYIAFIHPGVEDLDKIAGEGAVEQGERKDTAQVEEKSALDLESVEKPWLSSPEMVSAGEQVYKTSCSICHGEKGLGDGPGATPTTRNLVEGDWKQGSGRSQDLFETLQNGLEGTPMVSFKAALSKNQRWAVVQFIRSITENKGGDDPAKLDAFATSAAAD